MSAWFVEPAWQNYSSMYREAVTANEATTGMEVAHHRMAALYFGISAIESFLNLERRNQLLREGKTHDEVFDVLRNGRFKDKVSDPATHHAHRAGKCARARRRAFHRLPRCRPHD